ncbi:uncharacterized protein [Halyomorpha halys]|uniref:uncharacterized protein n=1 Tax=Halyomorpha halys TaxID=286706 RepID=UPI0034D25553
MLDIGTLIEVVQNRPCLWDQRCKEYYNRENVARSWEQVGEVLGVNYELAKNKWKHLRDNYRAELKKVIKSAGEDDEQSRYKSSWVWFDSLYFLKDFVFSKGKKNRQSTISEEESSQCNPITIKVEPDLNIDIDEPSISSEHSEEAETLRKRKMTYEADTEEIIKRSRRSEVEDDCHHFVLSILPSLRGLPLQNQMFLRAKIYELIYQEYTKTQNNDK